MKMFTRVSRYARSIENDFGLVVSREKTMVMAAATEIWEENKEKYPASDLTL